LPATVTSASHCNQETPSDGALVLKRRQALCGLITAAGFGFTSRPFALGRIPYGGVIESSLPWELGAVDPHDLNDPVAAFLAPLLFEPLFALDAQGVAYPTLAAALPSGIGDVTSITLRPLRWPNGKAVTAQQVAWSLERSRQRGAKALLAGAGRFEATNDTTVSVTGSSPQRLARALASPLTALLSQQSTAKDTFGLGPFRGKLTGEHAVLTRNSFASRGQPFLERVSLRRAPSLADALRDFEAHENNLGWFGRGLHEPRPGSRLVDTGHAGWVVLHAGQQSGRWARPGAAASLVSTVAQPSLERFGLVPVATAVTPEPYSGGPCTLVVRRDAPYLVELATTLAAILGGPSASITVSAVSPQELTQLKRTRQFGFLLDQVRTLGRTPEEHQLSLLTEAGLPFKPPRLPPATTTASVPSLVSPSLSLAVVGALHLIWATLPQLELADGSLANAWQVPDPASPDARNP
jgi:peptide/nickel transport system substrate-binding protein